MVFDATWLSSIDHFAYLLQILSKIWRSNLWTISLPDESYSRSVSCTLIYIYSLIYFSNISVSLLEKRTDLLQEPDKCYYMKLR